MYTRAMVGQAHQSVRVWREVKFPFDVFASTMLLADGTLKFSYIPTESLGNKVVLYLTV